MWNRASAAPVLGLAFLVSIACGPSGRDHPSTDAPAAAASRTPAPRQAPADPPPLGHGLDVSSHSGEVDWQKVAQEGHTFAFVKATEGVDLLDPAFDEHWRQLKQAGLVRGAYHFYVTEDDPEEQARFFIDNVMLEPGDLAPVVDVELIGHDTRPGIPQRLRRWLEIVEAHYGVKPIIYTMPNFWDTHMEATFGDYPLWVAEYEVEEPRLPAGWSEWHLWQWQEDADIDGVEKGADLSRIHSDPAKVADLVIGVSTP